MLSKIPKWSPMQPHVTIYNQMPYETVYKKQYANKCNKPWLNARNVSIVVSVLIWGICIYKVRACKGIETYILLFHLQLNITKNKKMNLNFDSESGPISTKTDVF